MAATFVPEASRRLTHFGNRRAVVDGGEGIGTRSRWFGKIARRRSVHAIKRFGLLVVGLKLGVCDRPGRRYSRFMLHGLKVAFS